MAMGQFSKALKDYESVFKVKPKDPDVRKKVQECRKVLFYNEKISAFENRNWIFFLQARHPNDLSFKIVKQRAFERAIASEEKEEAPLTNYENITVINSILALEKYHKR